MKEIISLRKPREKHFLNDDGTITMYAYNHDVHYLKNGNYEDIDNTLVEREKYYQNKANSFKISLFKQNNRNQLLRVVENDNILEYYLKQGSNLTKVKSENNGIIYEEVLEGIDLKYFIVGNKLKDFIILKNKNIEINDLKFQIKTNLTLTLKNNEIVVQKNNENIYIIECPNLMDKNQHYYNIQYHLEKIEEDYFLSFIIDKEILENESLYPLVIDPTIMNSRIETSFEVWLSSKYPNMDLGDLEYAIVGPTEDSINRALLKFPLPEIDVSCNIINASVHLANWHLQDYIGRENQIINVHEVTEEWNEYEATWNSMFDKYNQKVSSFFYPIFNNPILDEKLAYSEFDLTKLVKEWYGGKKNNGILLKFNNEVYSGKNSEYAFTTKEYDVKNNTAYRPYLSISYRIQSGINHYMNYNEVTHKNGKSYINTFNGNVVNVFDVTQTISKKLPVSLQIVHNSCENFNNLNVGIGKGWKFNYDQALVEEIIDSSLYLRYTTDSNAVYYLMWDSESNMYKDEDGLNISVIMENEQYVMIHQDGTKYYFKKINDIYKLIQIEDAVGNKNNITYDNQNRIIKITDGENQEIIINYESSLSETMPDIMKVVKVSTHNQTCTLSIVENHLIMLLNKSGLTNFVYDNNNRITSIYDEKMSMKMSFLYEINNTNKISKIIEYGMNEKEGKSFIYTYGANNTKVTDNFGKVNVFLFDETGRLVNQYVKMNEQSKLSSSYGYSTEFLDGSENNKINNKIKNKTLPQKHVNNLLKNSSFEKNTNFNFNFTNGTIVEEESKLGTHCLKLNSINRSEISYNILKSNIYTISFDFKYMGSKDVIFNLYALTENQKKKEATEIFLGSRNNFEYTRISLNGNFLNGDILVLEVVSTEEYKYCYIDNIQLETGTIANIYNLVENSSFNDDSESWRIEGNYFSGIQIENTHKIDVLPSGEKAITLLGNTEGSVSMTQYFNISGKKGDIYHVSFWYKSEGLFEPDGTFGNMVNLQFINVNEESGQGTRNLKLNPNVNDWQYFNASIVAESDYSNFSLNFFSGMEPNGFSITHVMINKDLSQLNYDYDSEGNLISYTDISKQEHKFQYDENNQLLSSFSTFGNNFSYEYDNKIKNRLLKAISSTGISNEIKYNDYGNPVRTIINNVNKDGKVQSNHIYQIRLKGTDKYLNYDYNNYNLILKDDSCNHTHFKIEQIENGYVIKFQEKYLTLEENIYFSKTKKESSLFAIEKINNGSYSISLKNNPSQYLTFENDRFILKANDITNPEMKTGDNQQFYFEDIDTNMYIESKAEYTSDGKYLTKKIDTLGKETLYEIDENSGLIKAITDSNKNTTSFTYDSKDNLTNIKCDQINISYEYNQQELLERISTENQDYRFTYDDFLNPKETKVGDKTIILNEYYQNNGQLRQSTYANGSIFKYDYDEWERIKTKSNDENKYEYIYDNLGNLSKIISNNEKYQYYYDYAMRICSYKFNDFLIDYKYENNNIIEKKFGFLNNDKITYSYNQDDSILKINFLSNNLNYTYDYLGRITTKNINGHLPIEYKYYTNGNKTSLILKSMKIENELYEYIYDNSYNIIKILLNGMVINDYSYDIHNQLIQEKNYKNNFQVYYTYDNYGNLLKKKILELDTAVLVKEDFYEYQNANWKDQLTKYNDDLITYDDVGNPIIIGNQNLFWKNGRELKKIVDADTEITFDYDINGIRTSKTVNSIQTKYFTENNHIIYEQRDNNMIYYIRDEKNNLLGFRYNDDLYFYKKNIQNDIIGIYDKNYKLIVTYEYDSWGKIIKILDSNGNEIEDSSHIAKVNPFRYRSYYYDEETELYYLNTRYYNPEWGRFLNADEIIGSTNDHLGYNLYAYVKNNPIIFKDEDGQFLSLGALVTAAVPVVGALVVGYGLYCLGKALVPVATIAYNNISTKVDTISKSKDKAQEKKKNEKKDDNHYGVYSLREYETQRVLYVGRTNDMKRREAEHKSDVIKGQLEFVPLVQNVSYEASRGLEEHYIMFYGTLNELNKRHGVGENNSRRKEYFRAANDYLGEEVYVGDGLIWTRK